MITRKENEKENGNNKLYNQVGLPDNCQVGKSRIRILMGNIFSTDNVLPSKKKIETIMKGVN